MIAKSLNDPAKMLNEILVEFVNNHSAALAHGDVIVKDLAAMAVSCAADAKVCPEFGTVTTTADDPNILGVVYDPGGKGVAVGDRGTAMVRGYHNGVKANGATDIAIGDRISSFTTAKIAGKAAATAVAGANLGHALEAYTTGDSAGVISAYIDIK